MENVVFEQISKQFILNGRYFTEIKVVRTFQGYITPHVFISNGTNTVLVLCD